jgi:hypothetical protein
VSETTLPSNGSADAQLADESVQHDWDRFAKPDLSSNHESHGSRLALTSRSSTNATIAIRAFDSLPAYDSSTALGNAFAKADLTDFPPDEDFKTSDDSEAF